MTIEQAIQLLHRLSDEQFDGEYGDERREALEMAVRALEQNLVKESGDLVQDLVKDCISRQQAIDAMWKIRRQQQMLDDTHKTDLVMQGIYLAEKALEKLPPAQPQRKKGKGREGGTHVITERKTERVYFHIRVINADTAHHIILLEGYINKRNGISALPAEREWRVRAMSDLIKRSQALNAINISFSVSSAWMNVAQLPSAPQWTPFSEELPEKEGMYIVCFDKKQLRKNEYQIESAYWLEGEWKYGMLERFEHRMPEYVIEPLKELTVTAWMSLPKPYGGESE